MTYLDRSRCLAALLVGTTSAFAQLLPPRAADEPAVELTPFVISSTAVTGWVATETLAGSRLRTDLKDIPNQIETLTKDFMDDLALTNLDQALIYTANVENQNDYMNSATSNSYVNPAQGGRIRGINTGTLSRNFFDVAGPTDNFNLERATIASGPNAILFGLGSPAGILDATPARALLRQKYGFTLQYDSEDSKRATFDANTVVVPGKLAVRLMGLSKREYTVRKPNLDRDERLYVAVAFHPFKTTSISLQGEKANRSWNRAPRINPFDHVTPWLHANRIPGSGYTVAKPVYNNTSFTGIANNALFAQASTNPIFIQGGSGTLQAWRNSVVVKNPSALPGVDQTFDAGVDFTIQDPGIFPDDVNLVGTSRAVKLGAYTKTIILEQKIADHLFLELAYNYENSYENNLAAGGAANGSNFDLNVDPNQFLPGTTTSNPQFGQLYFQGESRSSLAFDHREAWRASLSYELDLAQKYAGRGAWGRWLGRHRFNGLYTASNASSKRQLNYQRRILDDPVLAGQSLRAKTLQNWANDASRTVMFRHYFGSPYEPTVGAGSMTGGEWSLLDANGKPYTLYMFDTPLRSVDGKRLAAGQTPTGSLDQNTAQVFVWQGYFLPDREKQNRLVLTYGYRKDSAKTASLDAASTTRDFSGLFPVLWDADYDVYGPTEKGINRNLGVVARPLKWLTLFFNHSTTFNLNIGRYDPFGNSIPGAAGKGKDYGVRFDLWTDKVSLRLNRYENTLGPKGAGNPFATFQDIFSTLENRVRDLAPNLPTINVIDGNRRGFQVAGRANYVITSDSESTGYEAELNLTPLRNWNIRVNGSISEAVDSNIGLPWIAWAATRLPAWQSLVATNGEVDAAGKPVTWQTALRSASTPANGPLEQFYTSTVMGQAVAFMQAADGRAAASARPARGNLISNFHFTEGWLKGVNVGGAARWRAAPIIGYGTKTSASGSLLLDLDRAYKGSKELYCDAMLGYRGKLKAFGGFAYRLQLNVRNLLNENAPIPVAAITTGVVAKTATIEPRVVVLTFGVDF
jgi:iron complex outermembrane receptor protein